MGVRHRAYPWIQGVQCAPGQKKTKLRSARADAQRARFHPESIITEHGHQIIRNWLNSLDSGRPG